MRCGRAVCPPGPDSSTSTLSQAAVIGPERRPTRPASSFGSQCSAKIRSTSLSTPPSIASSAPPGHALLGRLEDHPDPCRAAPAREPAPAPRRARRSCAHRDRRRGRRPARVDAYGTSLTSCSGSASMSARSATTRSPVPMSQYSPVPTGRTCGCRPAPDRAAASRSVVRCSAYPSSGFWCSSRRNVTRPDPCSSSQRSSQGAVAQPGRRSRHSGSPTRISSSSASTTGRSSPPALAATRRCRW